MRKRYYGRFFFLGLLTSVGEDWSVLPVGSEGEGSMGQRCVRRHGLLDRLGGDARRAAGARAE